MNKIMRRNTQAGFNLLEVVVAIAVFAIGMLALGSLQGALSRSMADARLRTTAANIAEEEIETAKAFTVLLSDGTNLAYNDIVDSTTTETVNGLTFTINKDVTDYYYTLATDGFSTTAPSGATVSTYKQVVVTVSWDGGNRTFRGTEGADLTAAGLGTGSVTVAASIPALVTSASARVADELPDGQSLAPAISYNPGLNPDVVALSLDSTGEKFKESLLPVPDVVRTDELVETTFDVITYSSSNTGSQFLRREEFTTVSCECTLRAQDATNPGRRPVVWAGDEYAGGHFVAKPYGEPANNVQSNLCDTCCRDHHDGGSSADDHATDLAYNRYGPFKSAAEHVSGSFSNDHLHYQADASTVASIGDTYLEACRMVRVDGFFRVGHDFRQEDRYIFPADYLDDASEVNYYSDYVTGAASGFAAASYSNYSIAAVPPCIGPAVGCVSPQPVIQGTWNDPITYDAATGDAEQLPSWTTLPFGPAGELTEQLRSRGIYIDYISDDLRSVIACLSGGGTADSCTSGDVILDRTGSTNTLELLPFFDVQNTFLARWNETPINTPVDSTNEPLADNNLHSRGVISRDAEAASAFVKAIAHRGNLGFTDTIAIDPMYNSEARVALLEVQSLDAGGNGGPLPVIVGVNISGTIFETVPGNPTITVTQSGDLNCDQTSAGWECIVSGSAVSATITVTDYGKQNDDRVACIAGLTASSMMTNGANASAIYNLLGVAPGTTYNLVVSQGTVCPP